MNDKKGRQRDRTVREGERSKHTYTHAMLRRPVLVCVWKGSDRPEAVNDAPRKNAPREKEERKKKTLTD